MRAVPLVAFGLGSVRFVTLGSVRFRELQPSHPLAPKLHALIYLLSQFAAVATFAPFAGRATRISFVSSQYNSSRLASRAGAMLVFLLCSKQIDAAWQGEFSARRRPGSHWRIV
jgi:hypothetical protein